MKEILYYNSKTKELHLKAVSLKKKIMKLAQFVAMISGNAKEYEQAEAEAEKLTHKTVRLMDCDEFDLEYGYALLVLELFTGSKRKRKSYLEKKYGDLFKTNEKLLTISSAIEVLADINSYEDYKEHIKQIYASGR